MTSSSFFLAEHSVYLALRSLMSCVCDNQKALAKLFLSAQNSQFALDCTQSRLVVSGAEDSCTGERSWASAQIWNHCRDSLLSFKNKQLGTLFKTSVCLILVYHVLSWIIEFTQAVCCSWTTFSRATRRPFARSCLTLSLKNTTPWPSS